MTKTFRDLGVDPALCDALAERGITHPFPIQELTLPLALDGHDLIGQARTGTGKTLAFGLPLLQRLDPTLGRTQALVIVPTRELCLQVHSDLQIGAAKGLSSISVYGGVGYEEQTEALTAGAHVVVGTPGRLLDLLDRRVLDLSAVTQLVLDEADEMLDMGFLPDVERLVEACRGDNRHTMLFSATMPTAIVKLARRYMDHPTFTRADHEERNTAPLVTQHFFEVHRMDKPRLLARILQAKDRGGVYVFVRTKHMADRLVSDLEELRVPSIAIHGDLRQSMREKNLDRFRSGKATVLVCTEVAARGLDVTGVTHVVNYDCPDDEKMYLHRIGRTARAGAEGVAITFAEFNEIDRLNVIRKAVGATETEVRPIFSTSKELASLFDLPEERPWDHLSAKAREGSSRSKRESRTDGKPKSGRSREGRGGEHDARRPTATDQTPEVTQTTASDAEAPLEAATTPAARTGSGRRGSTRTAAGTSRRAAEPSEEAPKRSRSASRTRTASSEPAVEETLAATDAPEAPAATEERKAAGAAASRPRTRTRARATRNGSGDTAAPATSTEPGTGEAPAEPSTEEASERSGSGRSRARTSRSGGAKAATAEATATRPRSSRARSGSSTPVADTATDTADGSQDDTSATPSRATSRNSRTRGTGRASGSRSGRSEPARQEAPRAGRSRSDGARKPRAAAEREQRDPTVKVADRGQDARGTGRPQSSRRVKVEHLP